MDTRDYWSIENLKYVEPHFRLQKIARTLVRLAQGKNSDLLDIGCGPAALAKLLPSIFNYFGIDIAIRAPAPNLIELDIINDEIVFANKNFDFVVASGLFEYLGKHQRKKLAEIRHVTRDSGYFVMSYVNFGHLSKRIWPNYSNVQPIALIRKDIESFFVITGMFSTFHNRVGTEPKRRIIQQIQAGLGFSLPIISPLFAVEFIFVCAPKPLNPRR